MSGTSSEGVLLAPSEPTQPLPSPNLKSSSSAPSPPSVTTSSASAQEPTPPSSPSQNTAIDVAQEHEEASNTSSTPTPNAAATVPAAPTATAASMTPTPPNTLPQDSTLEQLSTADPPDVTGDSRGADSEDEVDAASGSVLDERRVPEDEDETEEPNAQAPAETTTASDSIVQEQEPPSSSGRSRVPQQSEMAELAGRDYEEDVSGADAPGETENDERAPVSVEQQEDEVAEVEQLAASTNTAESPEQQEEEESQQQEQQREQEEQQELHEEQQEESQQEQQREQQLEIQEPTPRRREPAPIIAAPAQVLPVSISVTNPSPATPRRNPFQYQYSSLIPRDEPPLPPRVSSSRQRLPSVVPLPPWQPDAEVTSCPICGSSFSFIFRRHHCRKCGRVVCANCSPHRIFIPKSFVVFPPAPPGQEQLHAQLGIPNSSDPRRSSESSDVGLEVRICEDCLTGETEQNQRRRRRTVDSLDSPSTGAPGGAGRFWDNDMFSSDSEYNRSRRRSSAQDIGLRSPTSPHHGHSHSHHLGPSRHVHNAAATHHRSISAQIPRTEQMFLGRGSPPIRSSGYPGSSSAARRDAPLPHTPQPPPRPRLKETDYCPICTLPLPPVSDDGDESAREAHIQDCIRLAEAAVSPGGGARRRTTSANSTPASHSPLVAAIPDVSVSSSPARSFPSMLDADEERSRRINATRVGRMVIYRATDKDTLAFAGDAEAGDQRAECVICFEEFEVGDAIARLECLCRYHKKCIREWFDRKGNGECPVHAVHE